MNFCRYGSSSHIKAYLVSNFEVSETLFERYNVFAMNKAWLGLDCELSDNFVEGFAEVHFMGILSHLK